MLSKPKNETEIVTRGKSNKSSLIGSILIILAVAAYMFFTGPLLSDVDALNTNITSKKAELTSTQAELEEYQRIEKEYDLTTQVKRDQILKSITTDLDQDEVIRDLIEITDEYDVELNSLSFSRGSSAYDGINSLRISASFEGNYFDLTRFLKGLELNERLFNVQNISVYITELEVFDIKRASFSLTINAYYLD